MIHPANKISQVQEYYFATKLREVRAMISEGKEVINAGIGNPDLRPPQGVNEILFQALQDPNAHGYQSYMGLPELREAISEFYKKHYGVELDSNSEIVPLMGSKEGILHISMAFLNPGDQVLVPDPGYPTYASATKLCEATPVFYDLKPKNNWQPDFSQLEQLDLSKVKLMWVNYPNMPTGASADLEVFEKLFAFAKAHNILIINDNPYSCVGYEKKQSILQVEGATEVCLELNSFSKTFNMAGWRVGMLLGKENYLKEVLKVKTNMDSGMFYAVQKGAIAALNTPVEWLDQQNEIYAARRLQMIEIACALDLESEEQQGGIFLWCKIKNSHDDKAFVDQLLKDRHIFVAPGSIFGKNGRGYLRFSLCVNQKQIATMKDRISKVPVHE